MNRRTFLALCGTGALGTAGCLSTASDDGHSPSETRQQPGTTAASPTGIDSNGPDETATPTKEDIETSTRTGTETTQTSPVTVEYDVRAGDVPDTVQSLDVTLQVVFLSDAGEMTACLRETYTGPYKPTPTPIPTPTQDACHRSDPFTIDLTEIESGYSIGPLSAPGSFAAGHALIVTEVTATDQDGEAVPIKGTGGHRAAVVEERPDGPYQVELGVTAGPDEAEYAYELVSTLLEPTN
ncbi:hypothetical protein [Halorhabdus sp. CUG00001]|uniref:hypothetical protein n=1 Tax=Halorhabdus sp. CUG00001 TaxID=2600297 RepID=UPI00131C3ED1|nr:hypothetical protein [Halorhabdus sp. CUG00001]